MWHRHFKVKTCLKHVGVQHTRVVTSNNQSFFVFLNYEWCLRVILGVVSDVGMVHGHSSMFHLHAKQEAN